MLARWLNCAIDQFFKIPFTTRLSKDFVSKFYIEPENMQVEVNEDKNEQGNIFMQF